MRHSKDNTNGFAQSLFQVLLLMMIGTGTLLAQVIPPSCNGTAACYTSAISKLIQVDGISGSDSSGYSYWDQTDSFEYSGAPYGWTKSAKPTVSIPYIFPDASPHSSPSAQPFDLTNGYGFENDRRGPLTFTSGFTVALMVWNATPAQSSPEVYFNFINANQEVDLQIIRRGAQWGLKVFSGTVNQYIYQYPWDAEISENTAPGWNYVFYTFTPDGKCRIDLFAGPIYRSALLDLGRPDISYTEGTSTSNPAQPPIGPTSNYYVYGLGLPDQTRGGDLGGTGFVAATFFLPLTQAEASSFYKNSYSGAYSDYPYPCNTGYALNSSTMPMTPCGQSSNWEFYYPPQ